jgi:ABC-type uncharacterized transport system ATPase subunit
MAPYKVVGATLRDGAANADLSRYGEVMSRDDAGRVKLKVPRAEAPARTARLVADLGDAIADLSLEDPAIEDVIDRVFSGEQLGAAAERVAAR